MKKIRIIVVDDENVVREGFVAILRLQQDIDVVGEAIDGILKIKSKPDQGTTITITVRKDPSVKPIKRRR